MAEPLKNLYNKTFFDQLAISFNDAHSNFNQQQFKKLIFDDQWDKRELKPRMRHVTESLHKVIQLSYKKTIPILKKVIKGKSGFEYMFFPDYVELYGQDDLKTSLSALAYFTEYASSEFAIRPFIIRYENETMEQMLAWSKHKNLHIRRLASEGCRPRLPWAMGLPKFKKDPSPVLKILDHLKHDSSEYVRRSVANNLNDISKDHPKLVLDIAKKWKGNNEDTDKLVKHACRTLLKKGNTKALLLFGHGDPKLVDINDLKLSAKKIKIGEDLFFEFSIQNNARKSVFLRVEYMIEFQTKSGKASRKIFKITENKYPSGINNLRRKQSFKDLTTRKHYVGIHHLYIVINGREKQSVSFELINK